MTETTIFKVRVCDDNFREIEVHKGDRIRSHHRTDYAIRTFSNGNTTMERIVYINPESAPKYKHVSDCLVYGEVLDCKENRIVMKGISVTVDWDGEYKPFPRMHSMETKWFPRYPLEDMKEPEIFSLENKGIYDSFEILHFKGDKTGHENAGRNDAL